MAAAVRAAEVRGGDKINAADIEQAVNQLRSDYRQRLGITPFADSEAISPDDKIAKLKALHNNDPMAQLPDKTLYALLRQRLVLQYTGGGWYGVHPLAAEILKEVQAIPSAGAAPIAG